MHVFCFLLSLLAASEQARQLAMRHAAGGRYADAERLLQPILAEHRDRLGPDHPETLSVQRDLGSVLNRAGRSQEALDHLGPVMAALERRFGPRDARAYIAKAEFATALREAREFARAEKLLREVSSLMLESGNAHLPEYARIQGEIAIALGYRGKLKESEKQALLALDLLKRSDPGGSPHAYALLLTLSQVQIARRRFDQAERTLAETELLARQRFPPGHPETGTLYSAIGVVHLQKGRYLLAEDALRKALRIHEAGVGPNHIEYAATLSALSAVLRRTHREAEARSVTARWKSILARTPHTVSAWTFR